MGVPYLIWVLPKSNKKAHTPHLVCGTLKAHGPRKKMTSLITLLGLSPHCDKKLAPSEHPSVAFLGKLFFLFLKEELFSRVRREKRRLNWFAIRKVHFYSETPSTNRTKSETYFIRKCIGSKINIRRASLNRSFTYSGSKYSVEITVITNHTVSHNVEYEGIIFVGLANKTRFHERGPMVAAPRTALIIGTDLQKIRRISYAK